MTQTDPAGTEVLPGRRRAMAVLLLANFMNLMDVTIVNVALPSMQRNLGASGSQIEWIVAGYVFAFGLLLLPAGRSGDIFGRRRMFLIGVSVFTLASTLCGLAPSTDFLIAARVFQGTGAAMMMPQTMSLVPILFPPAERGAVYGIFALVAGLASVSGPVIGGLLVGLDLFGLDWRPIFLVNLPVGAIALIGALRLVPPVPGRRTLGIDWVGIALAGITLFLVLFPLVEAHAFGWPLWCFAMMAAALPMGFFFFRWQLRQELRGAPQLLPLSLVRQTRFRMGALLAAVLFSAVPGFNFLFALYLQDGYGLSPLQSGLTAMPFSIGLMLAAPVSSRLGARFLRERAMAGAGLMAVAMTLLRLVMLHTGDTTQWLHTAPLLLLLGFGMANTVSPLFQTAFSAATAADSGSASGAVQSIQQVGSTFGVAIMGSIFFSTLGRPDAIGISPAEAGQAMTNAMLHSITMFVTIVVVAWFLPPVRGEAG